MTGKILGAALRPSQSRVFRSFAIGWEYIANCTVHQEFDGRRVKWNINSKGLRESEEYSYERNLSTKTRILVLGDSYTAGRGVEESERWTELVSEKLGS